MFVKSTSIRSCIDQAFRMFFRKRAYLDKLLAMFSPQAPARADKRAAAGASRVQDAMFEGMNKEQPPESARSRSMRASRSRTTRCCRGRTSRR